MIKTSLVVYNYLWKVWEHMMRIGIITWFQYENYGTKLQAIALQKYLRKFGHSVELIDFKLDDGKSEYNKHPKKSLKERLVNKLEWKIFFKQKEYYKESFERRSLKLKKIIERESVEIQSAEKAASSILYPIIPIGPWNKLYKLQMLKDNNISFSVPWSGEGLYFSFMAAQHSNKVVVGHRKVYVYRLNNAGSGLTNYDVQMGINALWNIKNIKSLNYKNSTLIENAANWHIWKNYHFLLKLIVATNSRDRYQKEYVECLHGMKKILPTVLLHGNFGVKAKIKMLIVTMVPVWYAKRTIEQEKIALQADLKNL